MTSENTGTPAYRTSMNIVPTATYYGIYPATVLLPDKTQHSRCKVFATPEGLAVYYAIPADGVTPDWFSEINFLVTGRPKTGYNARIGWDVWTADGLVTVTTEGGCGCGWPLKRWSPPFARTRLAWPTRA